MNQKCFKGEWLIMRFCKRGLSVFFPIIGGWGWEGWTKLLKFVRLPECEFSPTVVAMFTAKLADYEDNNFWSWSDAIPTRDVNDEDQNESFQAESLYLVKHPLASLP